MLRQREEEEEAGRADGGSGQRKDTLDRVQQLTHGDFTSVAVGIRGLRGKDVPGRGRTTPRIYLQ